MKKLLLLSAFISLAFMANAQSTSYHAFKVDVDFGYAIPSDGSGTKAGATFTIEPHYRVSDDLAIGLRIEGAGIGYEQTNSNGDKKIKVSLLTSYCATGDYYFMKEGFRPFAGAGAGIFTRKSIAGQTGGGAAVSSGSTQFGAFPRIGFEAGHFRFSAAYDIIGSNSSYAAFTLGFFLGGGKK